MKKAVYFIAVLFFAQSCIESDSSNSQPAEDTASPVAKTEAPSYYYMDVHNLEPGKVKFEDVAQAHLKDLATQDKFGVNFLKFWVDEKDGKVYCLSKAGDEQSVYNTHKEAHGLVPASVYKVTDGPEAALTGSKPMYIDVHMLGAGAVTAKDVAEAHQKDLDVETKYGVNFINYWLDEDKGLVMCLSEAPDSAAVKKTHEEAHGLIPSYVMQVKQGQ